MNSTRAIAIAGLGVALALAAGALQPERPQADAGNLQPIFSSAPVHVAPTSRLPTAAPTEIAPMAEQPPAAPAEQPTAVPDVVYVYLPAPAPPPQPQVVYVEQPAAAPQVVYVEQPAALVEQPPAALVEQPPAAPVEQPAAAPACAPGVQNAYCDLPVLVLNNDAPAPAEPITDRQIQQSRQRTR